MTDSLSKAKRLAMSSLILGIIGILMPILGAIGTRAGLWSILIGLYMAPAGFFLAIVGLVLGIIAMLRMRKLGQRLVLPAHGAALNLLVFLYLGTALVSVFSVPPMHNVSTDIEDPPQFTLAPSLRGENANSLDYDTELLGELQRQGYPDVQPLVLEMAPDAMYERAKRALVDMRMEITREDPDQGEIEAVATTFWFGFKDDIVVRLREVEGGTRMDIRSVSRVGLVDLGANAERILEISKRMKEAA